MVWFNSYLQLYRHTHTHTHTIKTKAVIKNNRLNIIEVVMMTIMFLGYYVSYISSDVDGCKVLLCFICLTRPTCDMQQQNCKAIHKVQPIPCPCMFI